jgi:hypothetical protein
VVMPPVPAYRSTPTDPLMEIFTAPVPATAMPAVIVPTVTVAGVPIEFGFCAAVGNRVSDPFLSWKIGALRQNKRRVRTYRPVHRDAQAILVRNCERPRLVFERLKIPNLMIAAITFCDYDRIAGAWRLI